MKKITLGDLLQATKGELKGTFGDLSAEIEDVATDSRKVKSLDVFFALVGERFDAHDFIDGISQGVGFVISKDLPHYEKDKFYVKVSDTQKALGDLAKWYKNLFQIPFIAVTGSVGKTTAKDMIASVLSEKYSVHKTQGNFNNTIGLPLTLLQLEETHEICVLEMGMDTAGEIAYMAEIVEPEVAVITNIGDAHIERLGSREGIRQAKFELLPYISESGYLLLNGDDPLLSDGVKGFDFTTFFVGKKESLEFYANEIVRGSEYSVHCQLVSPSGICKVQIPALGEHMVYPALFAFVLGQRFSLSSKEIVAGISNFLPTKMRMNLISVTENITFLDDTYNANPQSMTAGVEVLAGYTQKKTIAVLGDMLELGDFSREAHEKIGKKVADLGINHLVALGQWAEHIALSAKLHGMKNVDFFPNKEEALQRLKGLVLAESMVLFKASRGMALDGLLLDLSRYVKEEHLTD